MAKAVAIDAAIAEKVMTEPPLISQTEWIQRGEKIAKHRQNSWRLESAAQRTTGMEDNELEGEIDCMQSTLDCFEDASNSESLNFMIKFAEYCIVQQQAENICKHAKKKQVAMLKSDKVKRTITAHQFFVAEKRSEIKEKLTKTLIQNSRA
jgi:argonaute-like protein implicated in RNA metabolism and viral defense